jgi:PucR C-terminal helix-turn-helix domain/GGDEF-like domain
MISRNDLLWCCHNYPGAMPRRSPATVRRLEASMGALATAATARMDEVLPWYRAMPAENRSWVNLVAQAGVAAFVEWFRQPETPQAISADVFGTAPRELTRSVTLQQTVELVRVVIAVVEEQIEQIAPGDEAEVREAVLRYSREIAFAAAQVYAEAAEARGAWDARLESLVVDALLRGEADDSLRSRAAALGWGSHDSAVVVVGQAPDAEPEAVVDDIRRAARAHHLDVLTGVQGDRLVAILGGSKEPVRATRNLVAQFGPGPVVVGPTVPDLLAAGQSAAAAVAGLMAAPAWPDAPRPVPADDLLPERALAGDDLARQQLVHEVYRPLLSTGTALVETLSAFLEQTSSLEATARVLFVHPNTVRYRLRRVTEITGYAPADPRHALTLRLALALGRLADARPDTTL